MSRKNLWGNERYLLRIKIKILSQYLRKTSNLIHPSVLFGNSLEHNEIVIQAYVGYLNLIEITQSQLDNIIKNFSMT